LLDGRFGIGRWHQVFVIAQPGCVVEQVANCDCSAVLGKIRKNAGHNLVISKLSIMNQQHDCHCRELFSDRSQPEIRMRVNCVSRSKIGDAVTALERDSIVLDYEHRGTRFAG
jgi:hypothetical protein